MGIRSKFQGKHTKNCILKIVLKKNATVVIEMCPKTTCFVFPQTFYSHFLVFLHKYIYLPYLKHFATLPTLLTSSVLLLQPSTIFYKVAVATHNELGKTDQGQHPLGVLLAPHMRGSIWNNPKNLLDHHLFRNHTHQLVSEDHPDAVN